MVPVSQARSPKPLRELVREVVSIPTASYLEGGVAAHVRAFAEERGLDCAQDSYGNVYVAYRRGRQRRPLVIGAHMDHPGFVVTALRGRRLELEFRGGLSAQYGKGQRLRIYGAQDGEPRGQARITSVQSAPSAVPSGRRLTGARATLAGRGASVEVGDMALWDVDACRFRGDVVHARQCDDLIGCAATLATLDRVWSARANGHLIGLFTRAEEVGLCGASAAARDRLLPEDALVVAVETSSMAGERAEQGAGPIIRVGDAMHVFSPRVTQWMTALAQQLTIEDRGFRYQRKLMDGGTTEATSYDLYGTRPAPPASRWATTTTPARAGASPRRPCTSATWTRWCGSSSAWWRRRRATSAICRLCGVVTTASVARRRRCCGRAPPTAELGGGLDRRIDPFALGYAV